MAVIQEGYGLGGAGVGVESGGFLPVLCTVVRADGLTMVYSAGDATGGSEI